MARISIPGFLRLSQKEYSDVGRTGRDPEQQFSQDLQWYMQMYPQWRMAYSGDALLEKLSTGTDPSTDSEQGTYRWPVRFNMVRGYCNLYASLLWGRGQTAAEANDLFDILIDARMPGSKEMNVVAPQVQDALNYWWSHWFHTLRLNGVTQQWAGGCALKVAWDPYSPNSVYGLQLQTIQPEHFWPVFNPLNYDELLAVKIRFHVNTMVAREKYGMTDEEIKRYAENDRVLVEEHWDRYNFYIRLGRGRHGGQDQGVVARVRTPAGDYMSMEGSNPYPHPRTKLGIIPFVYVPRIRTQSYFGDSQIPDLEGIQAEMNKSLADYGDALLRGSHPSFGISDYTGPGRKDNIIPLPATGALNMGSTRPGGSPPKVHEFPMPAVPPQMSEFVNTLLSCSEMASGLTPAARGTTQARSGYAMALEMLPTTSMIDWERSLWTAAIALPGGINDIVATILINKADVLYREGIMRFKLPEAALPLRQHVKYRPVVPRDRTETIDEVVRLATVDAISPMEWLRRLGDIEDIPEEFFRLATWVAWKGQIEAAVAGRGIEVSKPTNPETPAEALPQVKGTMTEPAPGQAPKQPQGLPKKTSTEK